MISRQPKFHIGLRIMAAGCVMLWLVASSYCSLEHLCDDDHHPAVAGTLETVAHHDHHHDHAHAVENTEHAHREAGAPHDSAPHSHDSHPHDEGDNSCCSTLVAPAQLSPAFVIVKPHFQPLHFLGLAFPERNSLLTAPADKSERQANRREAVFTPPVCLGPAHRSLAPPLA